MTLDSQVISLSLAKRLRKLGVKEMSYFAWVSLRQRDSADQKWTLVPSDDTRLKKPDTHEWLNAYSVAELWERLPSRLVNLTGGEHSTHQLVCEKFPDGRANISYVCMHCKGNLVKNQTTAHFANELAVMLIFLIENKLASI